jgi:demethylsterigmatocystin 6-O-methyltransferase
MDGHTIFEVLSTGPSFEAFNKWIGVFDKDHKSWYEVYPLVERVGPQHQISTADPESATFVDVGGGKGHQTLMLKRKFPQLFGRFVVQDLVSMVGIPEQLAAAGIEFQPHDFFTPQPIRGAAIYYLRFVVHDWTTERAGAILSNIRDAMTAGYSRLLVNEWAMPDTGVSRLVAAADLTMMVVGGGMERTIDQYRQLMESAGLKITGVFEPGDDVSPSVIEAMVA